MTRVRCGRIKFGKLDFPQTLHDRVFNPKPKVTQQMFLRGTTWRKGKTREGGETWIEVCDFCGANCGQCGLTERLGNFNRPEGGSVFDAVVAQAKNQGM